MSSIAGDEKCLSQRFRIQNVTLWIYLQPIYLILKVTFILFYFYFFYKESAFQKGRKDKYDHKSVI